MALADFQTLVDSLVRDQSGTLTASDRDRALDLALARYSADQERTLVEDLAWVATGYTNALPSGWKAGSYIVAAEYPIGEQPISAIELALYQTPTLTQLMCADELAAGSVVRVSYAAPHLLQGGASPADTVPLSHREAFCKYAAHLLCQQMASHYSAERDSSINADGSNTDSRARNYAQRAKDFRSAYYAGIGKADPMGGAAASGGDAAAGAGDPAASVSSWAGRTRVSTLTNGLLGAP